MPQDRLRRTATPVAGVVLGSALGYLCARVVLVDSALSLIPWAVCGLALGGASRSRPRAALAGAAYGFALAYVFMLASYDGAQPRHTRLAPFLVFGMVGAVCGLALAVAGEAAASWRRRRAG